MNEADFLGLISDKNKLYEFLSKETTARQLGFAVLNDYFSDTLFPGISTLMPNLVYCYIIFSVMERMPDAEINDEEINEKLAQITTNEVLRNANKGFHGEVQENVVGTYRRFMTRYGFYDTDDGAFGKLNSAYKERKIRSRYKDIGKLLMDMKVELQPELQQYEITDMVQRCLIAAGIIFEYNKDKKTFTIDDDKRDNDRSPSLFDLAVFKMLLQPKIRKSNEFRIVVSDKTTIPVFENLGQEIFDDKTKEKYGELYQCYEAARFASVMQYYIKCRSNELIRAEKKKLRGEESKADRTLLKKLKIKCDGGFYWEETELEKMIHALESEADCKKKMECLTKIYNNLPDNGDGDTRNSDELIWEIIKESDTGAIAAWNRNESTEYLDTFRWEYRPEDQTKGDSSSKKIFDREAGSNTKCASYFIAELCEK